MNGDKISRCLDALPDAMLEEAMKPYQPCSLRRRIVRIAACLVIVIGLLLGLKSHNIDQNKNTGILTVTVYAFDNNYTAEILQPGVSLPYSYTWNPAISAVPGLPLTLSVTSDNYVSDDISFHITVDSGSFLRWQGHSGWLDNYNGEAKQLPEEFTLSNNSTIYWRCWQWKDGHSIQFVGDTAYVDIIIYEKEDIVGYAVLQISRIYSEEHGRTTMFTASLLESASFPDSDAEVTAQYVHALIDGAKT